MNHGDLDRILIRARRSLQVEYLTEEFDEWIDIPSQSNMFTWERREEKRKIKQN